jgi:hypothetical protein
VETAKNNIWVIHVIIHEKHVLWLQIAMPYSAAMEILETFGNVIDDFAGRHLLRHGTLYEMLKKITPRSKRENEGLETLSRIDIDTLDYRRGLAGSEYVSFGLDFSL